MSKTVSARLDDYYYVLFEKDTLNCRELLEFALDIRSAAIPELVKIRNDLLDKKINFHKNEKEFLVDMSLISVSTPEYFNKPINKVISGIETYYERHASKFDSIHDIPDDIIASIKHSHHAKESIDFIKAELSKEYPLDIIEQEFDDDPSYDERLSDACEYICDKFNAGKTIYKERKGWKTINDCDMEFIRTMTERYDVNPEDVAKELGILSE